MGCLVRASVSWPGCEGFGASTAKGQAVSDKPNVLIIWGDDIGQSNLSCYSIGLMG